MWQYILLGESVIPFYIGSWSFIGVVAFPVVYVVIYLLRCWELWMQGKAKPTDRVYAFIMFFAVFGFLAGLVAAVII
jgi:hypothetical protein